jgi:hypothetical protein
MSVVLTSPALHNFYFLTQRHPKTFCRCIFKKFSCLLIFWSIWDCILRFCIILKSILIKTNSFPPFSPWHRPQLISSQVPFHLSTSLSPLPFPFQKQWPKNLRFYNGQWTFKFDDVLLRKVLVIICHLSCFGSHFVNRIIILKVRLLSWFDNLKQSLFVYLLLLKWRKKNTQIF